ncbi:MAG: cytochrome c [Rhodobacteraceae bacterium]|jgi:cytochrome c556|nr:cytochrome c [Paracoccaceae bacterium]
MRSARPILAVLAACAVMALPVAAQQDPIQNAIGARKAHMQLYAHNLGVVGAMAQGAIPYDAVAAARAAANLDALAGIDETTYWPAESLGIEGTRALPVIQETYDDYLLKQDGLKAATAALVTAAGTDLAALQAAMGALGGACGACHQTYRAR